MCLQARHLLCLQPRRLLRQQTRYLWSPKTSQRRCEDGRSAAVLAMDLGCLGGSKTSLSADTADVLPADTTDVWSAGATQHLSQSGDASGGTWRESGLGGDRPPEFRGSGTCLETLQAAPGANQGWGATPPRIQGVWRANAPQNSGGL